MSAELIPADDAPLAHVLSFDQPLLQDVGEWADVPERRRVEVKAVLPLLARVHALLREKSLHAACSLVATTSRHLMSGLSAISLRRKYEAFVASATDERPAGDWRVLVKGYVGPSKQPKEFTAELKRVAQLNHCSVTEALVRIRERFAAGEEIQGYGTWLDWYQRTWPVAPLPKVFPRRYPVGWSIRNLRRYGPNKGARVLHSRGLAAAKKYFPAVRRDPSQLRPLEMIVIDDFELDCLCAFPGDDKHKPQVGRVAGLLAIDVATRRKLHWGIGQRLERHEEQPDGTMKTVKTGIARIDVQLFLHGLFAKFGLPPYQVTILSEEDRAAAAISTDQKLSIEKLFGGRVRVDYTGVLNYRGHENGFLESGGRPWMKGWIEAAFSGLWNILGSQRGYKGSNMRLNAPGDVDEKIRYTKMLLGQGESAKKLNLPPDKIALLRLPFQSPQELERAFAWACSLSDLRDNHRYDGFDRVTEFLLADGGEPQPFTALALLPEHQQTQVKLIERMESPCERWQRLTAGVTFTAIREDVLAVFLLTPKRVKFENNAITFTHERGGKRTGFSFVDRDGLTLKGIQDGTEFLGYFNPTAPDRLHITQLNGSRTGTLIRLGGRNGLVDLRDKAGLQEAAAIQATLINRVKADNHELHAAQHALETNEREHNAAVVALHKAETAALTPGEKFAAAAIDGEAMAHEDKMRNDALAHAGNQSASLLDEEPAPPPAQKPASGPTKEFSTDDFLK